MRRGQHEDFGKALRTGKKPPRQVNLPVFGPTRLRTLVALGIFVLVSGWWLTPLAPVTVRPRPLEDLVVPLQVAITAAVLLEPDRTGGRAGARDSPGRGSAVRTDWAGGQSFQRGMKALAQQHFDDARRLLAAAETSHSAAEPGSKQTVPPWKVVVAEGQNEIFAGRFAEAAKCLDRARKLQPDEPATVCQAAAVRLYAGEVQEAGKLAAEALAIAREKLPADDPTLAGTCTSRRPWTRSAPRTSTTPSSTTRRPRTFRDQKLGGSTSAVAASQNNQAVLYALRALYSGADSNQLDAHGSWSKLLPREHPYLAASAGNRAMLLLTEGKYAEASKIEKEFSQSLESLPAADRPPNGLLLLGAAMTKEGLAQYDAAARKANQALNEIRRRSGR